MKSVESLVSPKSILASSLSYLSRDRLFDCEDIEYEFVVFVVAVAAAKVNGFELKLLFAVVVVVEETRSSSSSM